MTKKLRDHICDESLFAKIFMRYSKVLHNYLYYRFGSSMDYEDKVQEAFIKLWDNCRHVSIDKAKSFLFRVAVNMVLNEIKHKKVVLNHAKRAPARHVDHEDPQFLVEEKEYMVKYKRALEKLTEGQREVFLLNRIDGKKHKEIAALLDISVKAVEKRLYKALHILREDIEGLK
jgi:RNA polymerase sigma-70 factor (ECF subfamily)